jgi:hypothetical protein
MKTSGAVFQYGDGFVVHGKHLQISGAYSSYILLVTITVLEDGIDNFNARLSPPLLLSDTSDKGVKRLVDSLRSYLLLHSLTLMVMLEDDAAMLAFMFC